MACLGSNPNLDTFVCINGGWVPKNNPIFVSQAPPQPTNDFQPPVADEFTVTETYPGSGITSQVMTRTADPTRWFVDGQTYRHAYGFVAKVEGIALKQFGTDWFWCHRLVIIDSAGSPEVGRVLYARLFAPRAPWEVQE